MQLHHIPPRFDEIPCIASERYLVSRIEKGALYVCVETKLRSISNAPRISQLGHSRHLPPVKIADALPFCPVCVVKVARLLRLSGFLSLVDLCRKGGLRVLFGAAIFFAIRQVRGFVATFAVNTLTTWPVAVFQHVNVHIRRCVCGCLGAMCVCGCLGAMCVCGYVYEQRQ